MNGLFFDTNDHETSPALVIESIVHSLSDVQYETF